MPFEHRSPHPPPDGGRLTRRRLVALAALAAAAPLGAGWRPGVAGAEPDEDEAYQAAFEAELDKDPDVRRHRRDGEEFLYRPRQLLVAYADAGRVITWLRAQGHRVAPKRRFAGVVRLEFDREVEVPELVARLRDPETWPRDRVPAVQPHHVVLGFGNIMGSPGAPPKPESVLAPPDKTRLGEGAGVVVGVCDTGIWADAANHHPDWLGGCYLPEPDDEDAVYAYADVLALQGGHGTFAAGVVRQAAPGVSLDPEQALGPNGIGDEESVVDAIGRLVDPSVVNLSLGCFTQDDLPPMPVAGAIAALPPTTVVVAAAGNTGVDRPVWPAALPDVVAVAAAKPAGDEQVPIPAPYSAFGPWVDATAVGARTSTYVSGRLLLPNLPPRVFGGLAGWAGTSFAAAHVSGRLAALMTRAKVDAPTARAMLLAGPTWAPGYGVFVP
ncbi:MAG TPA: S8/S53 family peptidase [Micromonosporaceae bacterium]|nr:S8/S53 family peptidase [Micromonosporaceae bacterium]